MNANEWEKSEIKGDKLTIRANVCGRSSILDTNDISSQTDNGGVE